MEVMIMDDYRTLQQILDLYKAMYHEEAESIKISLEIIGIYLSQEEIPLNDVIELLSGIAETRAMRQDRIIRRFRSEGILPYDYYYANYPTEIAGYLSMCTRKLIASMELSEDNYAYLKVIAENNDIKHPFYVELLNKMHKHGIYFKNEGKLSDE